MSDQENYLNDPDIQLMLAFKGGDQSSFEKLMVKYYPRVLNFVFRYLGTHHKAEDIAQETFIKVFRSVNSYQPNARFQTWLFTIAKNLSLNELRRCDEKHLSLDESVAGDENYLKREVEDVNTLPSDEYLIKQERSQMILNAIHQLPNEQRVAVLLRRYENFSYEEIAQTMNVSVSAVKGLLNRAKETLKEKLSKLLE